MLLSERTLASTPFAVVDVETTGLDPKHDRIVEIAVALVKPGEEPRVVLETLVNPERPMSGTEYHGLTDEDVADAPTFGDIAGSLVAAISNRVVAAHNAEFDVRMLSAELDRCGYPRQMPYVCTMLLPRTGDRGSPRLSLRHACLRAGVEHADAHQAASDALAAAGLLRSYFRTLRKQGLRTFDDLRATEQRYPYLASLEERPFPPPHAIHTGRGLKRRGVPQQARRRAGLALYLDAVAEALADLRLTDEEIANVEQTREELGLNPDELRAVHAKVFWGMLGRFVEDARLDVAEAERLAQLHELLSRLGWAPGERGVG